MQKDVTPNPMIGHTNTGRAGSQPLAQGNERFPCGNVSGMGGSCGVPGTNVTLVFRNGESVRQIVRCDSHYGDADTFRDVFHSDTHTVKFYLVGREAITLPVN